MAKALDLVCQELVSQMTTQEQLRNLLWRLLNDRIDGLSLNGPTLNVENRALRLVNNLNVSFPKVEGQSLMLECPELALSSGSACTSAEPHPSHVLMAIGLSEDQARSSLRFGLGRFTTEAEVQKAAEWLGNAHAKLVRFVA